MPNGSHSNVGLETTTSIFEYLEVANFQEFRTRLSSGEQFIFPLDSLMDTKLSEVEERALFNLLSSQDNLFIVSERDQCFLCSRAAAPDWACKVAKSRTDYIESFIAAYTTLETTPISR